MFIRFADFKIEAWYNQDNIQDLQKDWSKAVHAGEICKDGTCPFIKQTSFDYDPEHFLYYRARAITADIPNGNGDMFPKNEVKVAYKTFVGKGVFFNHNSEDPDNAFGIVLDAVFHENCNPSYVEILAAIDKEVAEEKHPGLVRKISSGILNSTSMSCICQEAECSICHNRARNAEELCAHMNPEDPNFVKGRRVSGNQLNFETNFMLTFTEDSVVGVPADQTAHIFQVFASLNSKGKLDLIRTRLNELYELLDSFEKEN